MLDHYHMSSGLIPTTRREAQEPYAGDRKAELQERDQIFDKHAEKARASSKRLQSALELYSDKKWTLPKSYVDISPQQYQANRATIESALSSCQDFGVSMGRRSEAGQFLDVLMGANQQGLASSEPNRKQVPYQHTGDISAPIPEQLTTALCKAISLRVKPILSLTLEDLNTDLITPMTTPHNVIQHLEVGLDGVQALIYGEAYLGKDDELSADPQSHKYLPAGSRYDSESTPPDVWRGWWHIFGIMANHKHQKSMEMRSSWLCFGVPSEALEAIEPVEHLKHPQVEIRGR